MFIAVFIAGFCALVILGVLVVAFGTIISSFNGDSDDASPLSDPIGPRLVENPPEDPFGSDNLPKPPPVPPLPGVRPVIAPRVQVEIGDSPVLGSEDAPVTIVEFSDFQCPFCARWYAETKGQLEEQYINTGKVKLVYMHYPLNFHPEAVPAALASECAYEQGKFWEYHDLIFENPGSLGTASYKRWAGDLGLDQEQFDECYDSGKYDAEVKADLSEGQNAGIRGTPGFLVNGRLISGAQPFAVFRDAIEAELNG